MSGLLDRWSKRKQKEQLGKSTTKEVAEKKDEKKAKEEPVVKVEKKVKITPEKKNKISELAAKILLKPLVTEKTAIMESLNQYSFLVEKHATKTQIKQAVFEAYGVQPVRVNIIMTEGKWVRWGQKSGRRSDHKKAIVTLPKGKSIALHEGV